MEIKKFSPTTKKEIEMIYEMYEGLIKKLRLRFYAMRH